MYVTLEEIKKHLNIEANFNEDDKYLVHLAQVAQLVVEKHIDDNLDALNQGGEFPPPLKQAMLLFIGDLYANRESTSFGATPNELPLSYRYLLSLYTNYKKK